MARGPWIIATFVLLGMIAGTVGVWWNGWVGRQAMNFWGGAAGRMIRIAPRVEVWRLEPVNVSASVANGNADDNPSVNNLLSVNDADYRIVQRHDLSTAPGLVHLRNAFLVDDQFDWQSDATNRPVAPEYALSFADHDTALIVLVDLQNAWAGPLLPADTAAVKLTPRDAPAGVNSENAVPTARGNVRQRVALGPLGASFVKYYRKVTGSGGAANGGDVNHKAASPAAAPTPPMK
ncbi:MAG: hypothetical protein SFX18_07600 [Pirellulales bacterium]|nr:hypothetical protein [Pirellulales bacterium]